VAEGAVLTGNGVRGDVVGGDVRDRLVGRGGEAGLGLDCYMWGPFGGLVDVVPKLTGYLLKIQQFARLSAYKSPSIALVHSQ